MKSNIPTIYFLLKIGNEFTLDITRQTSKVQEFMAILINQESTEEYSTESDDSTIISYDEESEL